MIVLVVDDQINVVNGIVSGVDWASAGVSKVLHACNATMARDVLENQPVDILLSDIEMPVRGRFESFALDTQKNFGRVHFFSLRTQILSTLQKR